jgi:hypothetical protein
MVTTYKGVTLLQPGLELHIDADSKDEKEKFEDWKQQVLEGLISQVLGEELRKIFPDLSEREETLIMDVHTYHVDHTQELAIAYLKEMGDGDEEIEITSKEFVEETIRYTRFLAREISLGLSKRPECYVYGAKLEMMVGKITKNILTTNLIINAEVEEYSRVVRALDTLTNAELKTHLGYVMETYDTFFFNIGSEEKATQNFALYMVSTVHNK